MGFSSPPPSSSATRKPQKTTTYQLSFSNLPPQITLEILSRLPPKSIFQCKCVCKKWLNLITDPYFVRLHSSAAKPGLIVHQSEMSKKFFKLVDFDEKSDKYNIDYDTILKFNLYSLSEYPYPDSNIVVDGSVDGILFLRDINYKHETLYVCNPLTREYVELCKPNGVVRYPEVVTHGFGVSRKTGEYKIVRIYHDRVLHPVSGSCLSVPFSNCEIYTLQKGNWRTVAGAPVKFAFDSQLTGVFLAGNIHWLIQDLDTESTGELISCFDLESEVFRPFPPPFRGRKLLGTLSVLRGCLSLCDNGSYTEIDIWSMKEYGVEKSWRKEFVVKKMPELVGLTFELVRVLKVFGDGSVLLMWGDYCMLYYCGKSEVMSEVEMDQPKGHNCIEAMCYVPSIVGLGSFVKENVVKF